jgi:hypothetical protein
MNKEEIPVMYNGWMIRKHHHNGKLCAYNFRTDVFINPLYNTWESLKSVIDAMKDEHVGPPEMYLGDE